MEFYTKKDLQEKFGISDNTVYSNLKTFLINTGKKKYSQAEHDRFALGRKMFEEGKSAKEVEEYFTELDNQNTQQQQEQIQEEAKPKLDPSTYTSQQATDTTKQMDSLIAVTVNSLVDRGVKKVAPYIPDMVASSLRAHLNAEQIMDALEEIFQTANENQDSDVDFLHQIIEMQPSQQHNLISEGKKQPQLPQASSENSTDSP